MMLPTYEWVTFDGRLPGVPRGAGAPLHIGPARWLLIAPQEAWLAVLHTAEQGGRGCLTDVTGRWIAVEFEAPGTNAPQMPSAAHPLSAALPLDRVLAQREAAVAWVFDCPVIVVRRNGRVGVLVEASYEHSFRAMIATL
jgi:sarcosine oxidase gamma subunit